MKQLQNNFTTPEQSKRLLDLGLPANSADCWYGDKNRGIIYVYNPNMYSHIDVLPCWSVGRLIEIYFICSFQPEILIDYTIEDLVEYLLGLFESVAMNFSKLED